MKWRSFSNSFFIFTRGNNFIITLLKQHTLLFLFSFTDSFPSSVSLERNVDKK